MLFLMYEINGDLENPHFILHSMNQSRSHGVEYERKSSRRYGASQVQQTPVEIFDLLQFHGITKKFVYRSNDLARCFLSMTDLGAAAREFPGRQLRSKPLLSEFAEI